MGSNNFFRQALVSPIGWASGKLGLLGNGGHQLGVNGGPYAGVTPTLAGANAGYGGAVQPGASPLAGATPLNPYVAAARQATGT
jgi:hypothetical protein